MIPSPWISGRMHSNSVKFCRSAFMGSMSWLYKRLDVVCIITVPESTLCLRKVCLFIQPIWPLSNVSYAQQSPTAVPWVLDNPFTRLTACIPQGKNAFKTKLLPRSKYKCFCCGAFSKVALTCNLFAECTETHD